MRAPDWQQRASSGQHGQEYLAVLKALGLVVYSLAS